jgi:hypothetical protein
MARPHVERGSSLTVGNMLQPRRNCVGFIAAMLLMTLGCQSEFRGGKADPPIRSVKKFAFDQVVAERQAGNWTFTDEIFKKHALALAKFMGGEPARSFNVSVKIADQEDHPAQPGEIHVVVFWDNGSWGGGYDIIFYRKSGELKGIMFVGGG